MAFLILCFSAASGGEGKGRGKGNVISSELQCFAFSNPIQVVTVAKRKGYLKVRNIFQHPLPSVTGASLFCALPGSPVILVTQLHISQTSTPISIKGRRESSHMDATSAWRSLEEDPAQRNLQQDAVTFHRNTSYLCGQPFPGNVHPPQSALNLLLLCLVKPHTQ